MRTLDSDIKVKYLSYCKGKRYKEANLLPADKELVFLDIETTGFDSSKDSIIEVGLVLAKGDQIIHQYSTLINPLCPIPPHVIHINGITNKTVQRKPVLKKVLPDIAQIISDKTVVAYNAPFEQGFLNKAYLKILGQPFKNRFLDAFELAKIILPSLPTHRQEDLVNFFQISRDPPHRAFSDVQALFRLYQILLNGVSSLPLAILEQIVNLSPDTQWELRHLFLQSYYANFTKQKSSSKKLDLLTLRAKPVWDNEHKKLLEAAEADLKGIDVGKIKDIFGGKSSLINHLCEYEWRSEQQRMAEAITEAFNERQHLVVEAGAGVGKSLAYLIPAVYFATENKIRIAISTKTKNLQDQMVTDNLPLLKKALEPSFKYCVVKGWENYPCWRKLQQFLDKNPQLPPELLGLASLLLVWLIETKNGDLESLNIHDDYGLWELIRCNRNSCLEKKCPWYQARLCFYYGAREVAKHSHIIVVNHSLLFADLAREGSLLPYAPLVVVDEAHGMEDEARKQLSVQVSYEKLLNCLELLYSVHNSQRSGFLLRIAAFKKELPSELINEVDVLLESLYDRIPRAISSTNSFFELIKDLWKPKTSAMKEDEEYDKREIRITEAIREQSRWEPIAISGEKLINHLQLICQALQELHSVIESGKPYELTNYEEILVDTLGYLRDLQEAWSGLKLFLDGKDEKYVYYVEVFRDRGKKNDTLHADLLDVGEELSKIFYSQKEGIIMASATLTVANSFDHFLNSVGLSRLDKEEYQILQLESSFDFERQMQLYVAQDMAPPSDKEKYLEKLPQLLIQIHEAVDGGVLTLFTNSRLMRSIYSEVAEALLAKGLILLCQGISGSRRTLREKFLSDERTSLFATKSFWEGVDAKGRTLRCVVVTRLPFGYVGDPILEAQEEIYLKEGLDWFQERYLPRAALDLKQGVGRLIRSREDKGVVVFTDSRLATKDYSYRFFQTLPKCQSFYMNVTSLIEALKKWDTTEHSKFCSKETFILKPQKLTANREISTELAENNFFLQLEKDLPIQEKAREVYLLGEKRLKSAVPHLIEYLSDSSANVRRLAASALGKIGDERATLFLIERARGNPYPQVRQYAIKALGEIGDKRAIGVLKEVLTKKGEKEYNVKAAHSALRKIERKS